MKAVLLGLVLAATAAVIASPPVAGDGARPCKRTTFETELVHKACVAGGQPAAKLAMKFESMWDTLKILVVVVGAIAAAVGIVVVAGGGTFGGAGTLVRW